MISNDDLLDSDDLEESNEGVLLDTESSSFKNFLEAKNRKKMFPDPDGQNLKSINEYLEFYENL